MVKSGEHRSLCNFLPHVYQPLSWGTHKEAFGGGSSECVEKTDVLEAQGLTNDHITEWTMPGRCIIYR